MTDGLLVYGAYGYTGRLVAARAVERGIDPVLAGRDGDRLAAVGRELGCETRRFGLPSGSGTGSGGSGGGTTGRGAGAGTVADHLADATAVLNCAGPFDRTADPLVDACLATGTDYLDVTGEIPVFVRLHRRDEAARQAGVTLLPGVGFDVVPTDCTAAHLVDRLPAATHLALGFETRGGISPGTARTALEGLADGGAIRVDGELRAEPVASRARTIDFGTGPREAATVPWGDVATAYWTTGVPNVAVYTPMPARVRRLFEALDRLGPALDARPVQRLLGAAVDRFVDGPDAETRASEAAFVWGEARAVRDGSVVDTAVSRLRTPEIYALTAETAVESARRVLAGRTEPGYATPAGAFGPDFVLEATDAARTDE